MALLWALLPALVVAGAVTMLRGGGGGEDADQPRTTTTAPREAAVTFAGRDGLSLRGTLRLPPADGAPVPGVVIVPGFGSTNRNGVTAGPGRPDPLYRDLSRALARAGVASLRYDKRGTGESVVADGQAVDFDLLVGDASAAVAFLGEQAGVDPDSLAFMGHDEGGLTALAVAGVDPRVGAVVLLSTPGRPLVDVLADDLMATSPVPGEGAAHVAQLRAAVDEVLTTGVLPEPADLRPALRPLFPPGEGAYVRSIFALDPVTLAEGVDVPVLLVRGEHDLGVSGTDVDRLVAALGGGTEVLVGAGVGATLAREREAGDRPGTARDETVVEGIIGWVATALGAGQV